MPAGLRAEPGVARVGSVLERLSADNGSGSTDDQANFYCEEQKKDDLIDTLTIGKEFEMSTKANTDAGPD